MKILQIMSNPPLFLKKLTVSSLISTYLPLKMLAGPFKNPNNCELGCLFFIAS